MRFIKQIVLTGALSAIVLAGHAQQAAEVAAQKKITVKGRVTDAATGAGLRGVRVTYKNIAAAISDSLGNFTIKVPSTSVTINLEAEGFQTKEVALSGTTDVKAGLYEETFNSFYDVAVLPTGNISKSRIPYAVSSVQTNGGWNHVTETPATYLQGRVAGLNVIRRSGTPGSGATLSLRGYSSLYATNQPLIVVDGAIYENNDYYGSINSNHYNDPLSLIDLKDVDNITVVKDGSALYGTKGANGVIFITTARARQLQTKIDLAIYGGSNFTPAHTPVLNADEYRVYLSDLLKSKGLSDAAIAALPYMNDNPSNPDYYTYHNNTDWQNEVFRNGSTRNIYLKVTGGDNIAKYGLSLGYMKNSGITKETDASRYNMRFNADLNLSNKLTSNVNLSFTFNDQNLRDQGVASKTNPVYAALIKSPLLRPHVVSDKGAESPLFADKDTFGISNPGVLINTAVGTNKNYRFYGNIGFNYEFSKLFSLSTLVSVTNDDVREAYFIPRKGISPDTLSTDFAYSRMSSNVKKLFALFNDTRLSFNKRFNSLHELTAIAGFRYQYASYESDFLYGYNSAIDELVSVGNGVNALRKVNGGSGKSKWFNTYFNVDYDYSDKYFLSLSLTADGSSRFGPAISEGMTINGNKFAVLPSVAAAWLVSSENFMQHTGINLWKLRASYGLAGNDDIGNYAYRQTYVSQNLLGVQGLVRSGISNPYLQWEKVTKLNFGTDLALFNERLGASFDLFQNETNKMVTYEALPAASGFSYALTNSGAMKTNGWEASLNARILNKPAFKWDMGFNIGHYDSKVTALPVAAIENSFAGATYRTTANATPNLYYGYKTNGVYVSDAEAAAAGISVRNADGSLSSVGGGDVRFVDVNGDKIIDAADRQVIGNPNPDLFGGFSTKWTYKQFSLEALFTFSQGNDLYNYTRNQLEAMDGYENQTQAVRNRWRNNGHSTDVPKATWGDPLGNSRFSDRWIEDGSYLRLRNISIEYNVPLRSNYFKYAVVYATGNNLATWTKYKGYDPEFNATESLFGRGVDNTLEPITRSVTFGVRIGL